MNEDMTLAGEADREGDHSMVEAPPLIGAVSASVAASLSLATALFTALGSPPFGAAVVIFLSVPAMLLIALGQWLLYLRAYIDYRLDGHG